MKANYDFSKGFKNPYADGFKDGYRVRIHYDAANGGFDEEKFYTPEELDLVIERKTRLFCSHTPVTIYESNHERTD